MTDEEACDRILDTGDHRPNIERSEVCGCFSCLALFTPDKIVRWTTDGKTALCPSCGVDSVIGSASGHRITSEFLEEMHRWWWEGEKCEGSGTHLHDKPPSRFAPGAHVRILMSERNKTPNEGIVRFFHWDHQKLRYDYYVGETWEDVPKHYFEADLEPGDRLGSP